jgi:hypothetical protein
MRAYDLTMEGPIWEYRPASHKTAWRDHDRVILLGSRAQVVIRGLLKADAEAYRFDLCEAVRERYERQEKNGPRARRARANLASSGAGGLRPGRSTTD